MSDNHSRRGLTIAKVRRLLIPLPVYVGAQDAWPYGGQ